MNKGKPCPYKPITCQEGECDGCQIYLDWENTTWSEVDLQIIKGNPWYNKVGSL